MENRTFPLELLADLVPLQDLPDRCEFAIENPSNEFAGLHLLELRIIERATHMTYQEAAAFEWRVWRDIPTSQIARVMGSSAGVAEYTLRRAMNKARRFPHIGLISAILETFGYQTAPSVYPIAFKIPEAKHRTTS